MSRDVPSVDVSGEDDHTLMRELQAFGQVLEHQVGQPISPEAQPEVVPVTKLHHQVPNRGRFAAANWGRFAAANWGRFAAANWGRFAAWAVAAGLLLFTGFGIGALWQDQRATVDAVDQPDVEASEVAETEQPDPTATTPPPPPKPSVVRDRAGTSIAVFESGMDWDEPTPADSLTREAVVARAVVDEIVRLDAFGGLDRQEVIELLTTGDLTVRTTLDPEIHQAAIATIEELYPNPDGNPSEPGVVIINNDSRAIVALASRDPGWDGLATDPRPTGSAIKSVVLAKAYEDGIGPDDLIRADGPCTFADPATGEDYVVGGGISADQSVAAATRSSNNCAFMRLGQIVGLDRIGELARELGIPIPPDQPAPISLPLGTVPATAIDMAGAYATFTDNGVFEEPWLIASIVDAAGDVRYQHQDAGFVVLGLEATRLVTNTLASNVTAGTGQRAELSGGHEAAGKTGTVESLKNAWFVGYTRWFTAAVWVGHPDPAQPFTIPGWNGFGGGLPATVWGGTMDRVHETLAPAPFTSPEPAQDEPQLLIVEGESAAKPEPDG